MPNGNSQGIVVPIQAKIEGWQEQIKQIQNALQQMMKGSDISKGLEKDLKRVTSMIDSFAKNANQRLTSDSQITAFTDKLRAVDEIFSSMGAKMSSISLGDLDVEYVTKNFQDLITQIEAAEEALSKGMETSFQEAIKGSDSLQKTFSKFDIDPKKFSMKDLGEELQSRFKVTSDELDELNRKFTETSAKISNLRTEAAEYSKTVKDIGDPTALAKSIIGDTSQLGVSKELNVDFLKDLSTKLSGVLTGDDSKFSDTLKARKEEISKALSELVDAKSIDEARTKLQALYDLIPQNMRGLFDFKAADFKAAQEQLVQVIPDETVISQKMQGIREALSKYKINEKDLDGIMLKAKDLVREGDFDSLPKIIGDALRRTKDIAEAEIPKIQDKIKELTQENKDRNTQIFQTAATKTNLDKSIQDYNKIIDERVKAEVEPLRKEIEELRARLEQQATSQVRGAGSSTKFKADQALAQSTGQAKAYEAQLDRVKAAEQGLGKLQGVVQRWFSIYAVIRMVRQAINSMISTIKELDKTITNIAIVTKMDQDDLWGQMPKYTAMAREYAASISGVYEVSQLYYQQGLQMADVMALTEQTLKMARISGLGYSDSTNYMTNAVRSFKMEMQDSQRVVDVYSAIAAKSATSVSELANAMSKTASSAQAVGSSFENTTAMMAVMIEATRESAENIGSALKSIISRYGEMKSDPSKLVDSEGEEMSLNKVDKALKTVGITIKDSAGQFRDFDDVIMELSSKWDTIDKNTQRYIATIMAGNRQQSRFLALVSSYDRLKELSAEAADSEDAAQLQFLKSLDSVDAKTQQLQTSIQALYTNSGLEQTYKGILDFANRIITSLDNISNSQGLLGVGSKIAATFTTLATLVTHVFTTVKLKFAMMQAEMTASVQLETAKQVEAEKFAAWQELDAKKASLEKIKQAQEDYYAAKDKLREADLNKENLANTKAASGKLKGSMLASAAGLALTTIAGSIDVNENRQAKAITTGLGGILSGVGTGFMIGGVPGMIMGAATMLPSLIESLNMFSESSTEKINRLKTSVTESSNSLLKAKDELKTLTQYKEKYDEASKNRYLDTQHEQEWIDLNNEIVSNYPELLGYIDAEGNAVANLGSAYDKLSQQKKDAYAQSIFNNIKANVDSLSDMESAMSSTINAMSNLYLSKDRGLTLFGKSGSWSNLTFGLTDPSKGEGNSKALEVSTQILQAMTESNGNWDAFANAVKSKTGISVGALLSGSFNYTNLYDKNILSEENIEYIQSVVEHIRDNFNEYFEQIDEYVESQLPTITNLYGEDSQFSEYSFLSEQVNNILSDEWKKTKESALASGKNISQAWSEFWRQIPTLMEQMDSRVFPTNATERALKQAEDIWANRTEKSFSFYLNLEDELPEEVFSLFTPEQIEELKKDAEDAHRKIWKRLETASKNAIEDNDITDTEGIKEAQQEFMRKIQYIPIKYYDSLSSKFMDILSSSSYSQEGRVAAIDSLNNVLGIIENNKNLTDKEKNSAYQIISAADLTSLSSIYEAQEQLKNLGINIDFSDFINNIIPNIELEFEQFTTKITEQFTEFDKVLSKIAKGLDLKDALEIADKLNITLADPAFEFRNGKYFITDVQKLREAYIKDKDNIYADLEKELAKQEGFTALVGNSAFGEQNQVNILDELNASTGTFKTSQERVDFLKDVYHLEDEVAIQFANWYDAYYDEYMAAIKTEGSGFDKNTTFSSYVFSKLAKSKENLQSAKEQYGEYQVNSILLTNGYISEFLDEAYGNVEERAKAIRKANVKGGTYQISYEDALAKAEQERAELIERISTGNIDDLPEELQEYSALIYDTYHSIRSSISNAMIASVNGNGSNKIKVTEANAAELKKLQDKGLITGDITTGNYVTIAAEKLSSNANEFLQYVVESFDTTSEQIKALTEYHKNKYSNSQTTSLNNVLDKSVFSYEDLLTYMVNNKDFNLTKDLDKLPNKMAEMGLAFNSAGEVYVKDYDAWIKELQGEVEELESNSEASQEEVNNAKAKLAAARTQQTRARNKAIKDIISNSNEISEEQQQALADSLGQDYDAVAKYFITDEASGTSRLNLTALQADIENGTLEVSDATQQALTEQINSIYDNAISYMSTATNLMSGGTTSQDEMQKFTDKMQELFNAGYLEGYGTSEDYFSYDAITKTYKLNAEAWDQYITAEKQRLADLGFETNEIQNILVKNAAEGVDISSFLKAENRGKGSAARTALKGQLQAWLTTKYGKAADDATLEYYVNKISNGGKNAVEVIKQLAQEEGREATSEEIQQAYRAKVTDLQNAAGQIADIVIGSNIGTSGKLFDILNELHMVDPTTGVVNSTYDAIKVYEKIYEEMAKISEATTSDLNTAYADLITANQQQEINALNILKNATNINSHDLGTSLASGKTPHNLSDYLDQNGQVKAGVSWLKALGADQYMITDFDQYAGIQGWKFGSEAYNQAYVDWQESMKEYQRRGEKYLNAGNISGFLQVTGHKDDTALAAKIAKGETDALPADLQQYAAAIENNYRSVRESITNALIEATGNGSKTMTVTEQNIEELKKLQDKGWITGDVSVGKNVTISAEKLSESADDYIQYLIDSFDSTAEQIKALAQNHENKYSKSRSAGLNKVIDKQTIAYEDLLTYMNSNHSMEINAENIKKLPAYMESMGLAFNNAGEAYIKDYDKWIANLEWDVEQLVGADDASTEEINAAKARLASAKTQQTRARNEAIQGMISNYNSITSEQQEALANALGKDYDEVSKYLEFDEASGTSRLDLATLKADIDNGTLEVSDATKNILSEQINSIYDEAVNYMSTAATFMGSGTTSQTDMQKFTQKMEELFDQGYLEGVGSTTDYFSYDSITKAYKLNSDAWQEYVQAEKRRLAALGFETNEINDILTKQAAESIDITGFLQAGNKGANSIARSKLQGELQTWLTTKYGTAANDQTLEFYTSLLESGGELALTAMEEIAADAGKELSTDEIKAAYRAQVEPIVSLVNSLDSITVGTIVDKNQIEALTDAGFTVDSHGLVAAVGDLSEAYKNLYVQMKATTEATTAELNSTLGKYLDNRQNGGIKQQALDALGQAAEMTYSDFLQLYTNAGIELTEAEFNVLESTGKVKALGGNKMQITDFAYIAQQLGWETGEDAYEAGYSAYIDSLIQSRNKYNVDSRAASQLSNLASAKVGQEVNIYDIPDTVKEALGLAGEETYTVTSEAARDTMLLMMAEAIDDSTLENNPQLKSQIYALKEEILAKRNRHAGLTGILGDNVSLADAESFAVSTGFDKEMARGIMEARGYVWDQYTQTFKLTNDAIAAAYGEIEMAKDHGATDKTINELTAAADDLSYTLSYGEKNNAIIEALQNYTNLSNEAVAALKTAFKDELTDTDWQKILTYDETSGTSKVNIKEFVTKLNELRATTQVVFNEAIQTELANLTDNYFNDISSGIGMVHEGTTSQADMLDMAKKINEATGKTLSVGDYFKYDVNLQTFTLSADAMRQYVEAQKSVFEALGITGEALDRYIQDQTSRLLATKLDFSSFYAANDRSGSSKVTQELVKAYRDWYESKNNQLLTTEMIQSFINTIDKGGAAAVDKIKEIKGADASSEELSAAYNAQIDRLRNAMADVGKQVGETITGDSIRILEAAGYSLQSLDDGTAVITAVGDMVAAYNLIYARMKEVSEATTADLNEAYANALTANEQQDIDAINALGDAMGMTYNALGELLAKYNIKLEDAMMDMAGYGIEKIGAGQIRINDFSAFASKMGWEQGSEEYVSAFKTYNDSLIKLNRRREKDIVDEVNNVADAKAGDKVNLTEFANYFDENIVNELLASYGASIKNGILTLGDNANIPGIISQLGALASQAGIMIPEEMAALEDKIAELLSNMADLISKGISGNLNNSEALSLTNWARNMNLIGAEESLTFTKTADGLKLSTVEAIKLYNQIKEIDGLQGKIVFDKLREDLEKNNENYQSMSAIVARIKKLRDIKDEADPTKREQYEAELAVAEEIARVRATSEDDSFNFMSNKIPAGQNNPINYFENWGKAWKTLRDSFKTNGKDKGKIEYEDFYNIMTEMGHIAEISGTPIQIGSEKFVKDAESAAKLIDQGAKCLTVAADGSIKVDLSKFGMDFVSGADKMSSGIEEGIKKIAQDQIDMLDSMIALLEVIVAMEGLEDVDVDHDMVIEIPEIAIETHTGKDGQEYITKFTDKYKTFADSIISLAESNPDVKKNLDSVKLNGHSMTQILGATEKQLEEWHISAEHISNLMTALLALKDSDLYDPDNFWESFMQIYSGLNMGDAVLEVNAGNHSIILKDGGDYSINFDSATVQANIERAVKNGAGYKNSEELQKVAQAAWDKLKAGNIITIKENYALQLATGEITVIPASGDKPVRYKVGSQTYEDQDAAVRAATLTRAGASNKEANFKQGKEKITVGDGKTTTTVDVSYGKIKLGNLDFEVFSTGDGKIYYKVGNANYNSREEALRAAFEKEHPGMSAQTKGEDSETLVDTPEYINWKKEIGVTVEPLVTITNEAHITKKVQEEAHTKIAEALNTGNGKDLITFAESVGINLGAKVENINELSVDELNQIYAAFGIESKSVSLDASVNASGSEKIIELIETGKSTATIDVSLNTGGENSEAPTIPDISINANIEGVKSAIDEAKTYAEKTKAFQKVDFGGGNVHDGVDDGVKYAKKRTALQNINVGSNAIPAQINSNVRDGSSNSVKQSINVSNNYVWSAIDSNVTHGRDNPVYQKIINKEGSDATGNVGATGSIGLAIGNAKAQGTLMGELGPELVVSNGHYFVVGQNGPEMVNLADDAIVFNHLQTKSLLEKGTSPGRGRAITNEQNAVSYATGNVNGGPAMASASAALAQLKQLRSMWESLMNTSLSDLAGKGGGGGGGGNDQVARQAWITQVERWYNLMQKIAQCEKDITHEETLRTKINSDFHKNGKAYYESQLRSLRLLQEQMVAQEELNISRKEYFEQRREQLNTANGPFNQWYSFDENGQLKYNDNYTFKTKDGKTRKGAFNFMSELMTIDEMGTPKYTVEEQYNALVAAGFKDFMHYDTSGKEILLKEDAKEEDMNSFYTASVQALWEHMDSQREEMQTLHDSIEDGENQMLELQTAQNEILEEIRNNQVAVEDAILEAIEDQRQRAIDNLSDERAALEESTSKFIEGLADALNKEKELYSTNQSEEELSKMRRQLAILKRSGGSGSEIRSLEEEIGSKEKDLYFDKQQQEIDAIQTASDLQLERLDAQIDLMTKTLEYEKEHGMLWADVYQVMAKSPAEITSFIMTENSKYWANSPLKSEEEMQNALFMADAWVSFRDGQNQTLSDIYDKTADAPTIAEAVYGADNSWSIFTTAMNNLYGAQWRDIQAQYKTDFEQKMAQTADITTATSTINNALTGLGDKLVSALSKPDPVKISGSTSSSSSSSSSKKNNTKNNTSNGKTKKQDPNDIDVEATKAAEAAAKAAQAAAVVGAVSGLISGATTTLANLAKNALSSINANTSTNQVRIVSGGAGDPKTLKVKNNFAGATGNAFAKGTLLGELGPELYVSHGKIHFAGMNGAEMINLPNDSIVFNHLQTANLIKSGKTGRGTPVESALLSAGYKSSMSRSFWNNAHNIQNNMLSFATGTIPTSEALSSMNNISDNVVIENATVNMNVSQISNDYDAQRAGEQAMQKILDIARKTSAKNSIRR